MIIQEVNKKAYEYAEKQVYFKTYKNEDYQHRQIQKAYCAGAELIKAEKEYDKGYEAGYSAAQLDGIMKLKESLKDGFVMMLDEDGDSIIVHRKDLDE